MGPSDRKSGNICEPIKVPLAVDVVVEDVVNEVLAIVTVFAVVFRVPDCLEVIIDKTAGTICGEAAVPSAKAIASVNSNKL